MSEIRVDTISEKTSANGVAIDSVTLKDGGIAATAASTITVADNSDTLTLSSTDADANNGPKFVLNRDSGSPADGDNCGIIKFKADDDGGNSTELVNISAAFTDVSNGSEDATFNISSVIGGSQMGRIGMSPTETVFNDDSGDIDFRVESNGQANMLFVDGGNDKVGIGTSSPTTTLSVNGILTHTGGTATSTSDLTTGGLHFHDSSTADGNIMPITFTPSATADRARAGIGFISQSQDGSAGFAADIAFYTRGAADGSTLGTSDERVRIHSEGVMAASAGIALGVGTANTASNVLDDYEEGTWTPTFNGTAGGASGVSYGARLGWYEKIGNNVTVHCWLQSDSMSSTPTGGLTVSGLPFTSVNTTNFYHSCYVGFSNNFASTESPQTGYINPNTTLVNMITRQSSDGRDDMSETVTAQVAMSGDEQLMFTASYRTA